MLGIVAVLVGPAEWPQLTSIAGVDVRLGDLLVVVVMTGAALVGRRGPVTRLHVATALLVTWGLVRAGIYGADAVSFAKTVQPLVVGLAIHRLAGGVDLGRVVRWFAGVSILTVPFWPSQYGAQARRLGLSTERWAGLPGGPGELGLLSGALVVLAWRQLRGRQRLLTAGLGAVGLIGTKSVSATVAATVALLLSHPHRKGAFGRLRRRLGGRRVVLALVAAAVLVVAVPAFRPDAVLSGGLHASLARDGMKVVGAEANPLIGGGWTSADEALGTSADSTQRERDIAQVHNTFIQWAADLGLIGLGLLVWWAVTLLRRLRTAPISFGLTAMVLVFMNSTGAFPSSSWGLLAVLMTCALIRPATSSAPGARRSPLHRSHQRQP